MESLYALLIEGWNLVFRLDVFLWIIVGAIIGTIAGVLPGLSSGMTLTIMLPLTFGMDIVTALAFLAAAYIAVNFAGGLTAVTLNTPGSPEAAATGFDGFPMTLRGEADKAMGIVLMSSFTGGFVSYTFMLIVAVFIGKAALLFGSPEIFILTLIGILILTAIARNGNPVKVFLSGAFGLLIGTIGMSPTGQYIATFNSYYLYEGVQIIAAMVGLFVFSEILVLMGRNYVVNIDHHLNRKVSIKNIISGFVESIKYPVTFVRSVVIGIIIGLIPAAGSSLSAFTSYLMTKGLSKKPETFGKGNPEGIVAPESANNATTSGAIMTTLALGIPGSITTAVMLGALTLNGLIPGPRFIQDQGEIVYAMLLACIFAQILMIFIGTGAAIGLKQFLYVKTMYLIPVLLIFSVLGTYAARSTIFDLMIMLAFGVLGYLFKIYNYSIEAFLLGLILGPISSKEIVKTMQIYREDTLLIFFQRPLSLMLIIAIVLVFVYNFWKKRRTNQSASAS